MFSSSPLVKLIVFEKQKTGKTNKNSTNTEEQSTVAAICGAILLYVICVQVLALQQEFLSVGEPEDTRESSHRRETVLLPAVWKELHHLQRSAITQEKLSTEVIIVSRRDKLRCHRAKSLD